MKRLLALAVLLGLLGVAFHQGKLAWPDPEQWGVVAGSLGDTRTKAAVKTALHLHRSLQPWPIEVAVDAGQVTLSGRVPSEAARSEAARLVAAVPQVRGVQNRLAVDPTLAAPAGGGRSLGENLDDRGLEVSVRLALSLHTGLAGSDIQVAAFRREVTLAGELAHPGQRQIALALAQAVTGVEDVVDRLRVRNQAPTGADAGQAAPDRLAAVRQALADNLNLAGYDLRCQASAETLHLTGQVQTGAERDLAGLLAREAWQGPVENLLQIVPKRDKMVEKTKDKGGTLP